jgi:hypothetical protein
MPLKLGGTTLTKVTYNGVELTKVIYNGTNVYEVVSGAVYYGFDGSNLYKYSLNLATLLATGVSQAHFSRVFQIRSDANHLYIYSRTTNRIHKILKTLPNAPVVAQTSASIAITEPNVPMFVDGTDLYSTGSNSARLSRYVTSTMAVGQAGSSSASGGILEILVDSSWVYSTYSGNRISRILKTNLSLGWTNSGSFSADITTFAQDSTHIYAVGETGRHFMKIPKSTFISGQTQVNLATASSNNDVVNSGMCAVDGNNFYFVRSSTGTQKLVRTDLNGNTLTQSTYNFAFSPQKILLTSDKIYVACDDLRIVVFDKSNINSGTQFNLAGSPADAIIGFHIEES